MRTAATNPNAASLGASGGWLKYQPSSALSRWWQRRFAKGNKRTRRIGIVALARKLLIALWRYLEEGLVPEGAHLKTPKRQRAVA